MARINPWVLSYSAKSYANADYSDCELDCSLGVNMEPLPDAVSEAIGKLNLDALAHYPHDDAFIDAVIARFAPLCSLSHGNIMLGCGSVDLLFTLNKLFLAPGKRAIGYAPQFATYVDDVHYQGAAYVPYFMRLEDGFRMDAEAFARFVLDYPDDISMVYVDNPNNPTGQALTPDQLKPVIAAAQARDAAILIDEAYGDFMPVEYSCAPLVNAHEHLYVLKTMSKGYGMAGMRLGYIAGPTSGIEQLAKLIPPYNGNGLARQLGAFRLSMGGDITPALLEQTAAKNAQILAALEGSPIKRAATAEYTPISLFYIEDAAVDLCEAFRSAGLAVVSGASFEGIGINTIRLMVPAEKDMPKLVELLKRVADKL